MRETHTYEPDKQNYTITDKAHEESLLTDLDKVIPPWMCYEDVMHIIAAHIVGASPYKVTKITIDYIY